MLPLEKNQMDGLSELMSDYFSKQDLTPVDYHYKGFGKTDFYCIREEGKIIACCFVGNQQATKQYKMCSYSGIYKWIAKLPTKLFGYPAFPKSDSMINHGIISYLYVRDNDKKLCSKFLRSVAAETDFSLLIWGAMEDHPLSEALSQMKTIHYGSRLYSVEWDKTVQLQKIGVEVALL